MTIRSETSSTTTTPTRGSQIPGFSAPATDGETRGPRDFYMRRNLALLFTHGPECAQCREYLAALEGLREAVHAEAGEVLAVIPASVDEVRTLRDETGITYPLVADPDGAIHARYGLLGAARQPEAAMFAVDRYGTVFESSVANAEHDMLAAAEVPGWLEFIACRCT